MSDLNSYEYNTNMLFEGIEQLKEHHMSEGHAVHIKCLPLRCTP
jgi:hypothetical protein